MMGWRRTVAGIAVCLGSSALTACDALLTDPASPTESVSVQFQIEGDLLGGTAEAFARVDRVYLRFDRPDESFRDTIVALQPADGVARVALSLETDERVEGLGIGAELRSGTIGVFQGGTVVQIVPGEPTRTEIALSPIAASIEVAQTEVTLLGIGVGVQLESAVLYGTGDTISGLSGTWTSEDPSIVSVSSTGLAVAQSLGQTRLEVRFGTLAATVLAEVLQAPAATGNLKTWSNPEGGDWSVDSNWSDGTVPVAGDSVQIALDGTYTVNLDVNPPALAALTLGGAEIGTQTLVSNDRAISVADAVDLRFNAASDLSNTSLTAASVIVRTGATLRLALNASLSGRLALDGLLVADEGLVSVSEPATTTAGSTLRIGGAGTASALTIPGFTNNGLLELRSSSPDLSSELVIVDGALTNGSSGSINAGGAEGTAYTISGDVLNVGSMRIDGPLRIAGRFTDPPQAPSSYVGNGSALTVSGLDIDGGVFDDVPLVSTGGAFTRFDNVTFQNMDPTVSQLTVSHPGDQLPFPMFGLTFSTTPEAGVGFYMDITDSDPDGFDILTIEVFDSSPQSGAALSTTSGGAELIW